MRLNKTLVWILLTTIISFAGNRYNLVDIGECILPISNQLIQTDGHNFIEKDYKITVKYPMAITIDQKNKITKASYKKIVTMLKLNQEIMIARFNGLQGESMNNTNTLIVLKRYMILLTNYPQKETEYMLEYCKRTAKTNK